MQLRIFWRKILPSCWGSKTENRRSWWIVLFSQQTAWYHMGTEYCGRL